MILIDTNLLVYAHRSATSEHEAAKDAIESACNSRGGAGIAIFCVSEFFSVVTHPKAGGRPSSATEAADFIALLESSAGISVYRPSSDFHTRLFRLARDLGVTGPRIFDLQIALTGLDNAATQLWTRDKQFVAVPGLEIVRPF